MVGQILWGSLILSVCTLSHLFSIIVWVQILQKFKNPVAEHHSVPRQVVVIGLTLAVIVGAHTLQVWLWALALVGLGALHTFSDAIYFSLVTYTTVGYGDVTIGPEFRIFGAMAAVTGLLAFGISTAFLVGLLGKAFPKHLG